MTYSRSCEFCGDAFEAKRSHARYCSEPCSTQGWVEEQVYGPERSGKRVKEHPLREAREAQEATDLKSKLSQIVYEGIVDLLKAGPVHADDLEHLFADDVRDICRRLVGAQFGSLASRGYIVEKERRKSKVPTRKGAKSGVYVFTPEGRAKLVGSSTDHQTELSSGGSRSGGQRTAVGAASGKKSASVVHQQTTGPGAPLPQAPGPSSDPTRPHSSTEEQRTSKPTVPGSNPGGGSQARRGVTSRSTSKHGGGLTASAQAVAPAGPQELGDESEVPAAAPEPLSLLPDLPQSFDPDQRAA